LKKKKKQIHQSYIILTKSRNGYNYNQSIVDNVQGNMIKH